MQKLPTRLERLLDFHASSPEDTFILFALAKEYEGMDDLQSAQSYYEQLISVDPMYTGVYYHLGKLFEKLQAPLKAFQTYQQGIQVARKAGDEHALQELAGAKMNLGDDEDFEGMQ